MMFDAITTMAPNVEAGQVRALGTTGLTRSSVLPDVPTVAEAGVPGYEATIWLGLMAPAGTPQPIVDKLNAEIGKVLSRPEVQRRLGKAGRRADADDAGRVRQIPARRHREMGEGGEALRRQGAVAAMPGVRLRVNGADRVVEADPETPLLSALRGPLGLMGTRFGCGLNQCGACNVLVDGRAVASCDLPLSAAAGKDVDDGRRARIAGAARTPCRAPSSPSRRCNAAIASPAS